MMDEKSLAFPSRDVGDDPLLGDEQEGLWRRVLDDEMAAFEIVVQRYQNLVASVAYSATGSFSVSEEVTQETFWQAWRQRTQLRDHGRLASWLCGIARNLALQAIKQERRPATVDLVVDPSSSTHDPAVSSISAEERQLVWETLEDIPDLYREALVLFYREGHSMLDVASALDVSTDVAKQRVHRGRELLRETLAARVEDVLVRTRPSRSLTARVMVGLAALSVSLKAPSTASAATIGGMTIAQAAQAAGASSVGGIVATSVKTAAASGASAGIMGGMLGAVSGLGGAFLGCWLPSQLAETMAERKLLEKHGRRSFALSIGFTLAMLLIPGLVFFLPEGGFWLLGLMGCATLVFTICIIAFGFQAHAEFRELQAHLPPDAPLNESPLAVAWHVATGGGAIARYLAVGGAAWADDFAVGGGAWANQANTDTAKELASSLSQMWMLQWMMEHRVMFIVSTIVIAVTPAALMRLAYRRCERNEDKPVEAKL